MRPGLIFLALLFFVSCSVLGQTKTLVHIDYAKSMDFDDRLGEDIVRLVGDVRLRQDSTRFLCDSAFLNEKQKNFDAFGNVHIIISDSMDIYSDRLQYDGNTRVAELFENVILDDGSMILYTDYLIYNRITGIGLYPDSGRIVSDSNTLTSVKGYYYSDTHDFYFREDVVLTGPDYQTFSDTLRFNTDTEIAYFYGPTVIRSEENIIYCENGWYDTRSETAILDTRTFVENPEQKLLADTIFYDQAFGHGIARGHVRMEDTINAVIISGAYGELWQDLGESLITDSAQAILYDDKDSLFMHADTLFVSFDENRNARLMRAYHHVKFFRTDLQGKCDSLSYSMTDSTIRFYFDPVMWSEESQLSSDSMALAVVNNQADSLIMYNAAFIISKDSMDYFNQINGKNIIGYFTNNKLSSIRVDGNAQSIYFAREENGDLIGVNVAKTSFMKIRLEDGKIKTIAYEQLPEERTYPLSALEPGLRRLRGFHWDEEWRPKNREDIFIWLPQQTATGSSEE